MGSWIWLAVFVREDETAVLLPRHQVDITIVSFFRRGARADFEIERGFSALIDEMMPIGLACGKACSHPRRKGLLPGVGDEHHLPLQDIDELVLVCVPVPLRGPCSRRESHEIHAELGELKCVPQRALLATGQLIAKRSWIDAAQARRQAHGIEPGLDPRRLLHQSLLVDLKPARHGRGLPARHAWPRFGQSRPPPRRTRAASKRGALYSP